MEGHGVEPSKVPSYIPVPGGEKKGQKVLSDKKKRVTGYRTFKNEVYKTEKNVSTPTKSVFLFRPGTNK